MSNEDYRQEEGAPGQAPTDRQFLKVQLVAAAVTTAPITIGIQSYLFVHFVMEEGRGVIFESGHFGFAGPLLGVALSFAGVAAAFFFRRLKLKKAPPVSVEAAQRVVLNSLVLASSGGVIVGWGYVLLTAELLSGMIMMAVSFWGMCLLFPTRRWLKACIEPE